MLSAEWVHLVLYFSQEANANEGPVRIQNKRLVPIHGFQEKQLRGLVFPKQNYNVLSPNFHIHVSVSDLYNPIPGSFCLFCCSQIGRQIQGI